MILGYQNQPVGTTPTHWVPALYVGTNGLLYAEIWNGAVQPIASATKVNDGQEHTAVFTLSGSTETLTLDGKLVGTLTGSPQPLDMTFDELGDGETGGWPEGTGGFDPFVGTLNNVVISTSSTVAGAFTFPVVTGGNPEDHLAEPAEPMAPLPLPPRADWPQVAFAPAGRWNRDAKSPGHELAGRHSGHHQHVDCDGRSADADRDWPTHRWQPPGDVGQLDCLGHRSQHDRYRCRLQLHLASDRFPGSSSQAARP